MGELTHDQGAAVWERQANDRSMPADVRLQAALLVIDEMRTREHERVRTAVVETLWYVRVNWGPLGAIDHPRLKNLIEDLTSAEELTRSWDMEPGWCCPFCEEVECDSDCPLAGVRGELG